MEHLQKDMFAFFRHVSRLTRRCTDSVLSSQPKCHFHILHRLAIAIEADGRDGCIYVSDLARNLNDAPQAVSRGLRTLEQDGLVERCSDPNDRRKTMVRLTPQGQQAHSTCAAALERYSAAVADRLGPDRVHRLHEDLGDLLCAMEAELSAMEQAKSLDKE